MHCGDQRHLGLCLGYVPALAYGSCRVSDQGTTLRASDLHNARATILNPFNLTLIHRHYIMSLPQHVQPANIHPLIFTCNKEWLIISLIFLTSGGLHIYFSTHSLIQRLPYWFDWWATMYILQSNRLAFCAYKYFYSWHHLAIRELYVTTKRAQYQIISPFCLALVAENVFVYTIIARH